MHVLPTRAFLLLRNNRNGGCCGKPLCGVNVSRKEHVGVRTWKSREERADPKYQEQWMPKTQIISPKLREPSGHFSHATATAARGRFVFISGMTARRADGTIAGIGDIEAQTRQVCENIKAAVEQAGGTMDDICRVDVYVRNMEHFDRIHKVRREYFKAPAPASTMVEVCKMTSPEYLIEINAIAVIDD
jgi:2-iminobutanoate/2-iminopropanoate deaminase